MASFVGINLNIDYKIFFPSNTIHLTLLTLDLKAGKQT